MPTESPLAGGCGRLRGPQSARDANSLRRRDPAGRAGQDLPDQPATQRGTRQAARHGRERAAGAFGVSAATDRKPLIRPAGRAEYPARQHRAKHDVEAMDHRPDGDAGAVQRLQDCQQRARCRVPGEVRARGAAQHRAGRISGCGDGLYERDGQLRALRGAAHQRPGVAGNPGDDETAARRRGRHADGYGAGRIPSQPGTCRSQRRRGRACDQQGNLRAGRRRGSDATHGDERGRPADPADAGRVDRSGWPRASGGAGRGL